MAEPDGSGISSRLRRLPGQLLLALINATAILVIVAARPGPRPPCRQAQFLADDEETWWASRRCARRRRYVRN